MVLPLLEVGTLERKQEQYLIKRIIIPPITLVWLKGEPAFLGVVPYSGHSLTLLTWNVRSQPRSEISSF